MNDTSLDFSRHVSTCCKKTTTYNTTDRREFNTTHERYISRFHPSRKYSLRANCELLYHSPPSMSRCRTYRINATMSSTTTNGSNACSAANLVRTTGKLTAANHVLTIFSNEKHCFVCMCVPQHPAQWRPPPRFRRRTAVKMASCACRPTAVAVISLLAFSAIF